MALTRGNIVKAVKARIYNTGLGQKPSLRQGTGTAAVTDDLVVFSVATGEGAKIRSGQILSSWNSTNATDAYGFYVLSLSTDELTCANGYNGVAIANSASVPGLLEHQANPTEYMVQTAIDDIVASYLFPEVFDIFLDSFTPNLASLQTTADADDEEIIRAWQKVGSTTYQVPIKLIQNMPTAEFSTGKMVTYDVRVSTDVDYSVKRRVSIANSTNLALEGLIAKGAAALCIEGVEEAPDEEGQQQSRPLWASFYNAKRQFETDIAKESVTSFKVDRN
ncbi:hypothetical protein LCGC14_1653770 [marine sediment metagenome]|uniref:Uncharacterized protein n=1 Tax=marine sediment metagenome TaxID=412755 RepID=A0A0F9KBZ9_9ZZZZ